MKYPLLVSNPANIFYLTGVHIEARDAWVLVTEKEVHFFTDARYSDILSSLEPPIIPHEISSANPLSTHIQKILSASKSEQLYFEADNITVFELKSLKKKLTYALKPTVGLVASLRELKKEKEINAVKKACSVIDACLFNISKLVRPGLTEYEIAFKLDSWLREKGHTSAFAPIVAVDEHAAIPHFNTQHNGKKKIAKNCIILIDAGANVDGYCSDITRMFVVGKASNTFMKCYDDLLAAQEMTIKILGTSKKYSEVDLFCRHELEKASIAPYAHATGHGIGIEVHEKPYVSFNSPDIIKPGHIVTIEPGTYIKGKFGIRIEDTVLIGKNNAPRIMTKFSKAL